MGGAVRESLRELAKECSLPAALEAMGERWSFLILRGSFNGLHHFEEFQSELGIAAPYHAQHGQHLRHAVTDLRAQALCGVSGEDCVPLPGWRSGDGISCDGGVTGLGAG